MSLLLEEDTSLTELGNVVLSGTSSVDVGIRTLRESVGSTTEVGT